MYLQTLLILHEFKTNYRDKTEHTIPVTLLLMRSISIYYHLSRIESRVSRAPVRGNRKQILLNVN